MIECQVVGPNYYEFENDFHENTSITNYSAPEENFKKWKYFEAMLTWIDPRKLRIDFKKNY